MAEMIDYKWLNPSDAGGFCGVLVSVRVHVCLCMSPACTLTLRNEYILYIKPYACEGKPSNPNAQYQEARVMKVPQCDDFPPSCDHTSADQHIQLTVRFTCLQQGFLHGAPPLLQPAVYVARSRKSLDVDPHEE